MSSLSFRCSLRPEAAIFCSRQAQHAALLRRLRLLFACFRLEGIEGLAEDALAKLLFLGRRQVGVTEGVDDAVAADDAVGANHLRDRHDRCYLSDGNTGLFEFG